MLAFRLTCTRPAPESRPECAASAARRHVCDGGRREHTSCLRDRPHSSPSGPSVSITSAPAHATAARRILLEPPCRFEVLTLTSSGNPTMPCQVSGSIRSDGGGSGRSSPPAKSSGSRTLRRARKSVSESLWTMPTFCQRPHRAAIPWKIALRLTHAVTHADRLPTRVPARTLTGSDGFRRNPLDSDPADWLGNPVSFLRHR